ncbi:ribonuclease H-like domain-containing protein [Tanacetum coccineum]|uniref:Ribonuclease H-like domain-containing protein n=1 Tax=Tanacetum coccineum TaxID=301880 RepID=A0ABQ5G610_9ASTR
MIGNIAYLLYFKEFDGGYVTFGGEAHGGRISGKGTLKTDSLDFEDILLKIPRKDNMYSFDMKNIVSKKSLTCLVAKVTSDESMLWHRRLGHINFKNINKLVKDNLDVDNGEPKSAANDQKQDRDVPDNENDEQDKSEDDSSPKEVNTAGQHVNTASPEVNTGCFKLNTIGPSVNTASSYDQNSPKDMFKIRASHTLEATHVEFFSNEDELEVDLGNILNSYTVPTTPNTRIHKDHPIKNMIDDVKSSVQTRRMTKPTSKQGFLYLPNIKRSLIEELDLDAGISLVLPNAADQGKIDDTRISDQPEEQRRREVSTGSGGVSTTSRLVSTANISTASELDSIAGVKAKDKGKGIMHESEPPKKIKKRVQVQMSVDEELAKNVFEEEQFDSNAEQEARFKAEQEQERIHFETTLECKSSWMIEKKL